MKNNNALIIAIILTAIAFLIRILGSPISIDTEAFLANPTKLINSWESISRISLCILKKFFIHLNLTTINIVSLIILLISYFILGKYILKKIKKDSINNYIIFIITLLTSLATIESYAFTLQILEISICYLLMILSFMLIDKIIYKNKYIYLIIVIPTIAFTLNAYQAFYLMYITLSCLFYIIHYKDNNKVSTIVKYVIILVLSCILSSIMLKTYFKIYNIIPSNSYLIEQINYKTSVKKGVIYLGATVIFSCIGKNVINISYLVCIIASLLYLHHQKDKLYKLSFLFLLISPFLISFVCGNYTFFRSQFSIPIITSFVFVLLNENKKLNKFITFHLFYQIICVIILFSCDNVRYYNDIKILDDTNKYYQTNCQNESVVFVNNTNYKLIKAEMIGHSFFNWDYKSDYLSNNRIKDFSISVNKKYHYPTLGEISYVKNNIDKYQDKYQIDNNILIVNVSK